MVEFLRRLRNFFTVWKHVATIPCPLKDDGNGRSYTLLESSNGKRRTYRHYGGSYDHEKTDAFTYVVGPWLSKDERVTTEVLKKFEEDHTEILKYLMDTPAIDTAPSLMTAYLRYVSDIRRIFEMAAYGPYAASVRIVRRALELHPIKQAMREVDYIEHEGLSDDELYAKHVEYALDTLRAWNGFENLPTKIPTSHDALTLFVMNVAKARR